MPELRAVELSAVPARQRDRLAFMLLPLGVVLLVAGLAPVLLAAALLAKMVGVVVALFGLLLLAIGHGLHRSVLLERQADAERLLDDEILTESGAGCGGDCDSCGTDDCAVKSLPRL